MCTDDEELNFSNAHSNLKKCLSTNSLKQKALSNKRDEKYQYSSGQEEEYFDTDSFGDEENGSESSKERRSPFLINRKDLLLFIQ